MKLCVSLKIVEKLIQGGGGLKIRPFQKYYTPSPSQVLSYRPGTRHHSFKKKRKDISQEFISSEIHITHIQYELSQHYSIFHILTIPPYTRLGLRETRKNFIVRNIKCTKSLVFRSNYYIVSFKGKSSLLQHFHQLGLIKKKKDTKSKNTFFFEILLRKNFIEITSITEKVINIVIKY